MWSEYCNNAIILVTKYLFGSIMRFYLIVIPATGGYFVLQKLLAQFCIWSSQVDFAMSSRYGSIKENKTSKVDGDKSSHHIDWKCSLGLLKVLTFPVVYLRDH